jgi:septum site-determining protein MinC
VASGAEIVAGGSINIFGALRGRAIAGVQSGESARILCLGLEAELIAVNGIYRTAEHWGPDLHGLAAQVRSEQGLLRLTPISKTLNG